jgi:hypothetical protein
MTWTRVTRWSPPDSVGRRRPSFPHPLTDDDQAANECDRRADEAPVGDYHDTTENEEQRSYNRGGTAPRPAIEHSTSDSSGRSALITAEFDAENLCMSQVFGNGP